MTAPEFMNKEVISMISVPANSKLTSDAKNYRLLCSLYILNIKYI